MPDPIPFRPRPQTPPEPAPRPPVATVLLSAALCGVYIWQAGLDAYGDMAVIHGFALIPAELFGLRARAVPIDGVPSVATLVTAQFLHGGLMHLIGNVVAVLLAGILVERKAGAIRLLGVFLLSGIAGLAVEAAAGPGSTAPILGASAGAAGLMGGVLRLDPRGQIRIPWPGGGRPRLRSFPAVPLIGVWLIAQVAGLAFAAGEPIAFLAHGTGFVMGALLAGGRSPSA
ncbi:rhomboid family intramembrane serine protease [Thalassobaculum sp. OXR-137]|uniref:rhomboid family intramembrane serine protease n=1 Tax=Thalassobaculum sp. OXR-137 TaxID=3100173 RepID=UPI002AC9EC56|nr:rhomboid family intramembrane serine protease [Thalassobaculum sp. OXR-137]WPZ34264.1 rhomboid family intramembrane serine protease [Thalassobaculum sp. OXR-137]